MNLVTYPSSHSEALYKQLHSDQSKIETIVVTQIITPLDDENIETVQIRDVEVKFVYFDYVSKSFTIEYEGMVYKDIPYGAAVAFSERTDQTSLDGLRAQYHTIKSKLDNIRTELRHRLLSARTGDIDAELFSEYVGEEVCVKEKDGTYTVDIWAKTDAFDENLVHDFYLENFIVMKSIADAGRYRYFLRKRD